MDNLLLSESSVADDFSEIDSLDKNDPKYIQFMMQEQIMPLAAREQFMVESLLFRNFTSRMRSKLLCSLMVETAIKDQVLF